MNTPQEMTANIRIEFKISQEFHYNSDKKYSFVDFMSNIGGLIGLWFGMSFIDTSALIRLVLIRIKILFKYYTNFKITDIFKICQINC